MTDRRHPLIAIVAFALVLAGCGQEVNETTTAGPGSSSTTTSTTAPPADPDTTTTTSAPPTTTTSTTTTTTTEPPLVANGVIVGFEGVLGWWDGSQWSSPADGEPPAAAGDGYHVLRFGDEPTVVAGGPLTGGCEFIEGSYDIDVGMTVDSWPQPTPIAVSVDTELFPGPVEMLDPAPAVYESVITDLLATRGVFDPTPNLVQVIRADLENDGVDEILIAAERNESGSLNPARIGDYSILVLRKVVAGTVETAIIADFIVEPPEVEGSIIALDTLRFTTVADFNGDGKMEIAYTSQYYEGSSTHLVEYVNDDLGPVHVLSVGCGV